MSIKVTTRALEEISNTYRSVDRGYRIMINGFGWGGPVFGLVQDEQTDEDYIEVIEEIKFFAHEELSEQFGDFTIDFVSNMFKKSFVVSTSTSSTC